MISSETMESLASKEETFTKNLENMLREHRREAFVTKKALTSAEADVQKAIEAVHHIQRQTEFLKQQHKNEIQKLQEDILTAEQRAIDTLSASNRDKERSAAQIKLLEHELSVVREQARTEMLDNLKLKLKISEAEEHLKQEGNKTTHFTGEVKKIESKIGKFVDEAEALKSWQTKLETNVKQLFTISTEFQQTIRMNLEKMETLEKEKAELMQELAQVELSKIALVKKDSGDEHRIPNNDLQININAELQASKEEIETLKSTLQFTEGHLSQVKTQLSSALDAVDVYMDIESKWCERESELMDTIQKLAPVDTKDVEVQVESSHAECAVQTEEGDQSSDVDEDAPHDGEGMSEKEMLTDGTLKVEENVDSPTIQPDDEQAK